VERRRTVCLARILDGARPEDLPFQKPTQFEFVIDLKTVQTLGRTVSNSLLSLADEVIQ
jgi:putative ABC transport system substrate-binding protein